MYRYKARPGVVEVNGKRIHVDSQNEAKLIGWFEASGFSGLWQRTNLGAANGGSRYTNDFELSVLDGGQTKRAIIEAKPFKRALTPNIVKRMQGTAAYYKTDLMLLYARQENAWYRIDAKTGAISDCGVPVPGKLPLSRLPKPFSLTAEKRGGRYYARRFNPVGWLADVVIGIVQGPKPKRRRARR